MFKIYTEEKMFVRNYFLLVLVLLMHNSVVYTSQKDITVAQDLTSCLNQKDLKKATVASIISYFKEYHSVRGLNRIFLAQLVETNLETAEPDIDSCHVTINKAMLNVSFLYMSQSRFPALVISGFLPGEMSFSVPLEELFK